ncbi:MAG TPA: hypothetical protein VG347_00960 [Verrucomicrobiae bacterium]|nr:hypothetical protein [Verrucomicrobiae bacterium]
MSKFFGKRPVLCPPVEFLSAKSLWQCAVVISLLFLVAHLAGLRAFTCILNGTVGSLALGWQISQLLALAYILIYLAFVLVVPVLVLAAILLTCWQYCGK